jgi:asparagine synthase (glutamine-hydrolysing)
MCGIAGEIVVEGSGRAAADRVRAMCEVIVHRGPDSYGELIDGETGIGMRRLAIVDVQGGRQPLSNEDGSVQVVCNGEIYNAPALARDLTGRGHLLRTRSDVEVIAHLYEEVGLDVAERLEGMFAFALWDRRARRLLLGRDRVGIKPLYVTRVGARIVFGSEARCLLAGGLEPAIDRQALHDYLTLGYVPQPASMFAGAWQVPPGEVVALAHGQAPERRRYWDLGGLVGTAPARSEREWVAAFAETFRGAVQSHLMSDVPLGVFLSGGLDSGTIVATMHDLGVAPIRTFTVGFEQKSFNEGDVARSVAERYGTEHHELIVQPDAAELLPKLVEHFGEPFADTSAIPVFLLSELARRHVTVVLSGEGGDEVLAGYETYRARRLSAAYARLPRWLGAGLIPAAVAALPVSHERVSFDYKARRFVTGAYLPPAVGHLWWKTILSEDAKQALYGDGAGTGLEPTVRLFEREWAAADGTDVDRLQYVDAKIYLPGDILTKVDRMTMAHSLESRVPFLDRAVLELGRQMPTRMRLRGLETKHVLRQMMRDRLPSAVLYGKKRGFNVPMPTWIAGSLRDFAYDTLASSELVRSGLVDATAAHRLLDEHQARAADHSRPIWTLLMLAVWYDATLGARAAWVQRGARAAEAAE